MKKIVSIVFLCLSFLSQAQTIDSVKIITLHPLVGKSIDVNEKKSYFLFPEYKDSIFDSAEILKYSDSLYTIRYKSIDGKTFEKPANTKDLDEMYAKIEKLKPHEYVKSNPDKKACARKNSSRHGNVEVDANLVNVLIEITLVSLSILINSLH